MEKTIKKIPKNISLILPVEFYNGVEDYWTKKEEYKLYNSNKKEEEKITKTVIKRAENELIKYCKIIKKEFKIEFDYCFDEMNWDNENDMFHNWCTFCIFNIDEEEKGVQKLEDKLEKILKNTNIHYTFRDADYRDEEGNIYGWQGADFVQID